MQREIRFRAWCNQDKLMYYNIQNGITFDDGSVYHFENFLGNQRKNDYHKWNIMQYTGVDDCNGNKIFEGDIVKVDDMPASPDEKNYICIVVFDAGCFGVESEITTNYKITLDAFTYQCPDNGYKPLRIEVIGNIYENPELLNGNNS